MDMNIPFKKIQRQLESFAPFKRIGKITASKGTLYEINLSRAQIGSSVEFVTPSGERTEGEVVAINHHKCLVMPYHEIIGVNSETLCHLKDLTSTIKISQNMLGRVLDFQAKPIDDKGNLKGPFEARSIYGAPMNPLQRPAINQVLDTGVNAINAFLSIGKGQRMAIMAGPGIGKSVLLGMMARYTKADINVIALVGERGREVLEFIENDIGPEGLKKSIIVVATSENSALVRSKAAFAAITIAEYFRDQNYDVLFMMDSVTRFSMANREISLSSGEPPAQKGYTPSVFAKLPKLLERVGTKKNAGSITGLFTVLVEGGDMDEPIADAVRSIVDGHIILSRDLAAKNHFPAIDVLQSISRVMSKVVTNEHKIISSHLRDLLATYKEVEDLINVGAYSPGTNKKIDKSIIVYDEMMNLLKQDVGQKYEIEYVYDRMVEIARKAEESFRDKSLDKPKAVIPLDMI
jgi:flagellum-specific ATP synthase